MLRAEIRSFTCCLKLHRRAGIFYDGLSIYPSTSSEKDQQSGNKPVDHSLTPMETLLPMSLIHFPYVWDYH